MVMDTIGKDDWTVVEIRWSFLLQKIRKGNRYEWCRQNNIARSNKRKLLCIITCRFLRYGISYKSPCAHGACGKRNQILIKQTKFNKIK